MVLEHVRNQCVNVLAHIVDLLIDVQHSSVISADILIFCELFLLIWLVQRLGSRYRHSFAPDFYMEVYRVCELIEGSFDSILGHHIADNAFGGFFVDV